MVLDFLAEQPLVALIVILVAGLAVGKVKIWGISLGAAAALFVAIALSAFNPDIQIPPLIHQLGLALFVYAIGLSAGEQFFREFRTRGWRLTLFTAIAVVALGGLAYGLVRSFSLDEVSGAGMFAGALTSTPGMAAIVAAMEDIDMGRAADAVVGYSLVYPGAVLACIIIAAVGAAILKVDHVKDAKDEGLIAAPLEWRTVRIAEHAAALKGTAADPEAPAGAPSPTVRRLAQLTGQRIVGTRVIEGKTHRLANPAEPLHPGMEIMVNGTAEALDAAFPQLGEETSVDLPRDGLEFASVTISSPKIAGMQIGQLDPYANGFSIARLRRGDTEVVPDPHETLQYSDRIRVIAAPEHMPKVHKLFGDSESKLANVDLLPFMFGLLVGLLLGFVPIPLPGGHVLSLGGGGGPIVAGLIFGALNRTGKVSWQVPYHANRTISALGLSLFLAGVGTSAGAGFRSAMTDPKSLVYIGVGFILTVAVCALSIVVGMYLLKLRWDEAMGVAAGICTNPAIIAYLNGQTGTELAQRGYATVYPTAMIGKIIVSQMLLLLLLA